MTVMGESTTWKSKRNTDRCVLGRLVFTAAMPKQLVGGREREQHRLSLSFFLRLSLSRALISSTLSLTMMSVCQWLTALLQRNAEHGRFWPCKTGRRRAKKMRARERETSRVRERERGRSVSLAGFAAHLSEVCTAAKFEPEHQGAVCHCVHIFTLCGTQKKCSQSHAPYREMQFAS